jgi:energy-coupling factor transporter ATP-binding protein EcfA2
MEDKKIIEEITLTVHNIEAIQDFIGTFKYPATIIQGNNGIGKSTLLKIIAGIFGADVKFNITTGQTDGDINATIKTRDGKQWVYGYTKDANGKEKAFLVEPDGDGIQEKNVKSTLQTIFGYEWFELHDFINWTETAEGRRKIAKKFLDAMPEAIRNEILKNEEFSKERTGTGFLRRAEINKEIEKVTYVLQNTIIPEDLPKMDEVRKVQEGAREAMRANSMEMQRIMDQIEQLNAQINTLRRKNEDERLTLNQADQQMVLINSRSEDIERRDKASKELLTLKQQEGKLTDEIKAAREANKKLLADNVPVEGMAFDNDEITVNGLTLDKMAMSDKKLMFAKVSKATNKVGVILMDDFESVTDPARRAAAVKFAKDNDCLLIISEATRDPLKVQQFTINEV